MTPEQRNSINDAALALLGLPEQAQASAMGRALDALMVPILRASPDMPDEEAAQLLIDFSAALGARLAILEMRHPAGHA